MSSLLGPCLWFALGVIATPEPPPLTITWDAPNHCASATEIEAKLLELLATLPSEPVTLAGVVTSTPGGFQVDLVVTAGDDTLERHLQAETCQALVEATVLVAAVATGSQPVLEPEPPTPAPQEVSPPCPDPPPLGVEPDDRRPAPNAPVPGHVSRWSLGAEAGLSTHALTPLTWAVGGRLQWIHERWQLALGVRHDFGQLVIVEGRTIERIQLTRGQLAGCWAHTVGRWEIPLCAGVSLGSLVAQPITGIRDPARTFLFWGAAEVSVGATLVLDAGLALYARAELLAPFVRPTLVLGLREEAFEIYRAPVAGGALALGAAFRIP